MNCMRTQKNVPEQLKLADFADKSLLILDDDDPLRGRLARAMEKKGFQVKEAKSVAEGLNIAKTAPTAFAVIAVSYTHLTLPTICSV